MLVFALLESKMSQPRNFLGGQMLSALVGITTRVVIHQVWIAGPVGMSLALVAMQLTATTHPPGDAHRGGGPGVACRHVVTHNVAGCGLRPAARMLRCTLPALAALGLHPSPPARLCRWRHRPHRLHAAHAAQVAW